MNLISILIIAIYIINILTIIALIFFERKNVAVTISWLLILTILPIFGFILYLFIGSSSKIKLKSKIFSLKEIEENYKNVVLEARKEIDTKIQDPFYKDIVYLNTNNSMSIFTNNNDVTLFTSAKDKYEKLIEDINNAKESIHIEYFIIKSKDEIGQQLINLLAKRAKDGIKVKVIYDRLGAAKTRYKDFKPIIENGGEVLKFLPSLFSTILNVNYRLHRKIVVIDNEIAYTGGINIGDDYLGKDKKIKPWRDTAVRVTGDCVSVMQLRFLCDWFYLFKQYKKNITKKLNIADIIDVNKNVPLQNNQIGMQFLSSGPDSPYEYIKDSYIKLISNAEKYVYIETPYFIPDETLLNTIRIAKLSGVDVRIIIPGVPDKKFVYNLTLSNIETLLKYGIKVYLYNGFIHAKSIVSDDFITSIGACNMDVRSFMLNYENGLMFYDKDFAIKNKDVFLNDISNSKEITLEDIQKKGVFYKFKQAFLRFLSPLA